MITSLFKGIMDRTLASLGVLNGAQLECDDYAQNLTFKLIVFHNSKLSGDEFEFGNTDDKNTPKIETDEFKNNGTTEAKQTNTHSNDNSCQLEDGVQEVFIHEKNVSMEVNLSTITADGLQRILYLGI
jgi:hypothetical protein